MDTRKVRMLLVAMLLVAISGCDAAAQPAPQVVPAAPAPTAAPAATSAPVDAPALTTAEENAIQSAQDYLDYAAFSRTGLIEQVEYEGYTKTDATFAVDSLVVDWNEQAYRAGKSYLEYSSFSLQGLIEQLEYEGYTAKQAKYGATKAYND